MKHPGYEGVQRMDIIPTTLSDRFRVDRDYDWITTEKQRLLEIYPHLTHRAQPEAYPGSFELLSAGAPILAETYPDRFALANGRLTDKANGKSAALTEEDPHPLMTLARFVQEDIALLRRDSHGTYRLVAGCVCFPSDWSLSQKLGKSVREIHAPIPELNSRIGDKIDSALDRLLPARPLARVNMLINFNPTLSQFPELDSHKSFVRPQLTEQTIGDLLWLRNEYETLSKLPLSDDVVFTIRTHQTQLRDVPPEVAAHLAAMHREMPLAYRSQYRKLSAEEHSMLLEFLDSRAAGA
jgi:hypothetical protein